MNEIPPIEPGIDQRRPPDPRYGAIPPEGRFIEPATAKPEHQCPLPQQWTLGALWQCPDGHLWVVGEACELCHRGQRDHGGIETLGRAWWPAGWWQRRRYGPGMKRARLSMARTGREQNAPMVVPHGLSASPLPPTGRSGVSSTPPCPPPPPPPPPPPYHPTSIRDYGTPRGGPDAEARDRGRWIEGPQ